MKRSAINRRVFLRQCATTAEVGAAAALLGCKKRRPRSIVPDVAPSDDIVPGVLVEYRTVCRACPVGCGATARVREGRVVKLEGNPLSPLSGGALCVRGQAELEELYAPGRLAGPVVPVAGGPTALGQAQAEARLADGIKQALAAGTQVAVLTRPEPGAVGALLGQWLEALGQHREQVVVFDPAEPVWLRQAARATFAIDAQPVWDLSRARRVVAIGADLVEDRGSPVEHAGQIADLRADPARRMIYVGPRLSLTAAAAHQHIELAAGDEAGFVLALLREVLALVPSPTGIDPAVLAAIRNAAAAGAHAGDAGLPTAAIHQLADELVHDGPGLVVGPGRVAAGDDAVPLAQAIYLLDLVLGAAGTGLRFAAPSASGIGVAELTRRAAAGTVGALVIHHADPLGFAPLYDDLAQAMARIPFVVAIGNRLDATAQRAHLVLPDHHDLERWDDLTVRPGVRGVQQPAMTPVYDLPAAIDVLVAAARSLDKAGDLPDGSFAESMQDQLDPADIERGGVFGQAPPAALVPTPTAADALGTLGRSAERAEITLLAAPSLRFVDGAPPHGSLLQEVPDPLTTIAWSGWVELHPELARRMSVGQGEVVELQTAAGQVQLPAFVTPGVRPDVVAAPLAYALPLLAGADGLRGRAGAVSASATGRRQRLVVTGGSLSQHDRRILREVPRTADRLPPVEPRASFYDETPRGTRRWAMAIDLDRCNGCGACVAACMVENNCPVVGADEMERGRDMQWLRIDRFFSGPDRAPRAGFMPVMCQQCGDAPCEPVCPVYATYHTGEGLNAQVYNRCVGTRFCENNCPYEVRRFNWFDWPRPEPSNMGLNPDVTVRERGVTEKCTFCVQRIRVIEENAKIDGRRVADGEVVPACAQTCPTRALVFGDLYDPASQVARLAASGRAYRLLEELNTEPGVHYLARRRDEEPA